MLSVLRCGNITSKGNRIYKQQKIRCKILNIFNAVIKSSQKVTTFPLSRKTKFTEFCCVILKLQGIEHFLFIFRWLYSVACQGCRRKRGAWDRNGNAPFPVLLLICFTCKQVIIIIGIYNVYIHLIYFAYELNICLHLRETKARKTELVQIK